MMISNLKIIRVRDLIKVSPRGKLDFKKGNEALKDISSIKGAFTRFDVLVDTRGTESQLSVTEIFQLAVELQKTVQAGSQSWLAKIAVLCPIKNFDHAKFFELCAQNRGLNVRAFTSFEKLFEWLSEASKIKKS